MREFKSKGIQYSSGKIQLLDQQRLPMEELWLEIESIEDMFDAIYFLKVRGAPMIGVAAVLSLAQLSKKEIGLEGFLEKAEYLKTSRPTAVNLMNCVDRITSLVVKNKNFLGVEAEAISIAEEDVELCQRIANRGAELVPPGTRILTHCNTGGVATAGIGTALGVILEAHSRGLVSKVYVSETRPLLQGARLTAWELEKAGVDFQLITDSMAGMIMHQGLVDQVWVGSDRVALNGDFANKIGTYSLSVLAKAHNVGFFMAAPKSTIDFNCKTGSEIPIELRSSDEIHGVSLIDKSLQWAKSSFPVYNPAFDVTPVENISAMVIDSYCFSQKDLKNMKLNELKEI
ncbi:MAG: S-methyl-5-thioribose-1-phosphate isomerase [Bdellovibrionales bacterium]